MTQPASLPADPADKPDRAAPTALGARRRVVRGLRVGLGLAALAAIGALAWNDGGWQGVTGAGTLDASRTFSVTQLEPGRYAWRLETGRPAMGPGVISESALEVARSELTEVHVPDELTTGDHVAVGDLLVQIGSARADGTVADLRAQRARRLAERDLAVAGGRAESVAVARERVAVAVARLAEEQTAFDRLVVLAGNAGVARAELDAARDRVSTRQAEVEAARAAVRTAQQPPRPEEIAALDAQLASVDALLADALARVEGQRITAPVAGVVEVGGPSLLRVYALDPMYVRALVPESARAALRPGSHVTWSSPSVPARVFSGTVAEIAESVVVIDGRPRVWVSAEIANPDLALRPGMTGTLAVAKSADSGGEPVALGPGAGDAP